MVCILNGFKKGGCNSCSMPCAHMVAIVGLNGKGGRVASANIPKLYQELLLNNSPARVKQHEIYDELVEYVERFSLQFYSDRQRIKSVYLFSENTGTGKTSTACAMLNEFIIASYIGAIKRGLQPSLLPGYFLDVNEWQELYNEFNRPNVPQDIAQVASREYYRQMEKAVEAGMLVMDDVGVRSSSEAFRGDLHKVINKRLSADKPTVYTSNVGIKALEHIFDKRVADRVRASCIEYRFSGVSMRGANKNE